MMIMRNQQRRLYALLLLLLVALARGQVDDESAEDVTAAEETPSSEPPNCDSICADKVEQAVSPLRDDLQKFLDELDFVVRDRNELKSAHEMALQQRTELQAKVDQANERSDGLQVRVTELERDLQSTQSTLEDVKGQLAVALVELDTERSKIGFFGRLQEEIKQWYGTVASFVVKIFKKKTDDEL
jgi:chromosome segregation ATPase